MKRRLVWILMLLWLLPLQCLGEEGTKNAAVEYRATSAIEFHLRVEPESEERLSYVPQGKRVKILSYHTGWCYVQYQEEEGWCRPRWLSSYQVISQPDEAQYLAYTAKTTPLCLGDDGLYQLLEIPDDKQVSVYQYGTDWCMVGYNDMVGFCETRLLWGFRSLDAARYSLPGVTKNIGVVALNRDVWISSSDFPGLTAVSGALIAVTEATDNVYSLPVWRSAGEILRESGDIISFTPWETARHGDLIGGFTTFYDGAYGGDLAAERAYNIDLACRRIHNQVIWPGERFSYNALCGPYKKENGYLLAPNISNDGTGYGGGVCQVTTTLYNAILSLPIQIEEWAVHQRSGVPYIPQYFDAAVGSRTDLVFTNTLHYPIRLFAMPQEGAVTVLIFRMEATEN